MMLHSTLAVFRFELFRSLTFSRIAVWLLLTSFPIFIVGVIRHNEEDIRIDFDGSRGSRPFTMPFGKDGELSVIFYKRGSHRVAKAIIEHNGTKSVFDDLPVPDEIRVHNFRQARAWVSDLAVRLAISGSGGRAWNEEEDAPIMRNVPDEVWGLILFGLIPEVITLFGLLLWVTPVVQAELEGRTWIYLAVRPRGRVSTLLGKYLTAITWTALSGWISATVCVWLAHPSHLLRMWVTMIALVGFACLAYGALYSLIGVFLHRRAMVIAVAYTLIFEFLVSFVPALINQLTVQYRLRNLLVDFMNWRALLSQEALGMLLGNQPAWVHVLVLIGTAVLLLFIATQVIQHKEYATADEA